MNTKNTMTIAIANQKGGVGKTTTAFNLGAALALEHDKRVLLVDLDPQANLSEYLGFADEDGITMSDLVQKTAVQSFISPDEVRGCIRRSSIDKLNYLPSDINLANAEIYMANALSRETILKRILQGVKDDYDIILIDCLPSLGVLMINAVTASDGVLIPVQTQKFSMDGVASLTSLLSQVKSTINPDLSFTAILPTMADNTNVSKNALMSLNERYDNVLKTVIHKSVEAPKSSESGIALCKSKNRLGDEYKALADEIMNG